MGQTVRNQGPYDRLWMPGVPHNRSEQPERSKIEYLDDRRRAKAAQSAGRQDALAYDSNFRRAAAVHGERGARQHFLRETPQPARSRPQGVGGRQQMAGSGRSSSVQARGRQPEPARSRGGVRPPAGRAQTVQKSRGANPASGSQPRRGGQHSAGRARPQGAARPAQPRTAQPGQRPQPRAKAAPAPGRNAAGAKTSRGASAAGGQSTAARNPRPRSSGRSSAAVRGSERPKRDTVTDFHSVEPGMQAKQPRKQVVPKKKNNGHGRKLTPTYELKAKNGGRPRPKGARIMEGGVVGFDMGAYGRDAAPSASARPVRPSSVITTVLTIAICFVLLTAVLAGQARLSNYSQQNANLEKSIGGMEESISKLKMQIALEEDLGNIQERAAALGLSSPDDSQIQYVDLSSTDEVKDVGSFTADAPAVSAVPESLLDALVSWFQTVFSTSALRSAPAPSASAAPVDG